MPIVSEAQWARFGLARTEEGQGHAPIGEHVDAAPDSLFAQQQTGDSVKRPWWEGTFLVKEPLLFGTWDGVFTTVMVNIFGVIAFLRMGWIVAEAGTAHSVLLLMLCSGMSLIPVLSAVGICERCQVTSGGIYFLISHILGARIGAAVGLLYTFAQAVGLSLVAVGFGESMAHLLGGDEKDVWLIRFMAVSIIIALLVVNLAGVLWVIKLQLVLLVILVAAVADLAVGSLFRHDESVGVVGFSSQNFERNMATNFTSGETLFSVFGVFFSNFIGVLSGVNMAGDLKDPSTNIPLGEMAAVGCSTGFCFIFIITLGGTCDRSYLFSDTMIAEHVSATRVLFLAGLYISSFSSILGTLYGTPRVLQAIAAENIIPFLSPLKEGRGANNFPIYSLFVLTALSVFCVMLGDLNFLAILSTIPFLITYAVVNYSYVSLAMTYDLNQEKLLREQSSVHGYEDIEGEFEVVLAPTSDLDQLFPERKTIKGNKLSHELNQGKVVTPAETPTADIDEETLLTGGGRKGDKPSIVHQPESWYSMFCNRWISFAGVLINIMIIFPMNFKFAVLNLLALGGLYFYIGKVTPGAFPGISDFSMHHMWLVLKSKFIEGADSGKEMIVSRLHPSMETTHERLTEKNEDYSQRKQYHQTEGVALQH